MKISCIFGFHKWHGCKCLECSKARDEGHNWAKDCEKCAECGAARQNAHKWTGCKCSSCGNVRDQDHDWGVNCEKCSRCGKVRSGVHDWGRDSEKCIRCGLVRSDSHQYICTPNQTSYPMTFAKFGFYAKSSPNALDLWLKVLNTLLEASEHMVATGSVEIITTEQVDALCLSVDEWATKVPDANKASDLMKAKFLLGIAGLYRTSQMNAWLDLMNPMFRAGSWLMMTSKGGTLLQEVLSEVAKSKG